MVTATFGPMPSPYTVGFENLSNKDVERVGGKNASLGELLSALHAKGIRIPAGFATTTDGFREFLHYNHLEKPLAEILSRLDTVQFSNLRKIGTQARQLLANARLPEDFAQEILQAYRKMCVQVGKEIAVAVRSSASAEDLPTASFAGQHSSFLGVSGEHALLKAVQDCFVSLYNDRAIHYRIDKGFAHEEVALSVGVQQMVRTDLGASGVIFTLDPDSGFRDVVVITGIWGLGENLVQGTVTPDEYHVYKQGLLKGKRCILSKKTGGKEQTMVFTAQGAVESAVTVNLPTPESRRKIQVLSDSEIEQLARWSISIEEHYRLPMDIEWARDGISGALYILQARPETVHARKDPLIVNEYTLLERGEVIARGTAVGNGIVSGKARILQSPEEVDQLEQGDILITGITNPDWDPVLKKAGAIVTARGGRTSHAAIVARETGSIALVGCGDEVLSVRNGELLTVCCAEGKTGTLYRGALRWTEQEHDFRNLKLPRTSALLILGDPGKAYTYAMYPSAGVGLLRLEFIISNSIGIHPMALVHTGKISDPVIRQEIAERTEGYASPAAYFTEKLAQAVGTIAAAFYPREVLVRMSDFKSNEYAHLLGGNHFEVQEENPMIGFRGASRYYHDNYREGFGLECAAMRIVREEMGLDNVQLMIPFCRTPEEGRKVLQLMAENGLRRGEQGLKVYVMAEIPSNILMAREFAAVFDGFSIGSNDLTQLTLGVDRDSALLAPLFDENNAAVKQLIAEVIRVAHDCRRKTGLCGQAPSDDPAFAAFLIRQGIDSIAFNPDAFVRGIRHMLAAEGERTETLSGEKAF